MITCTKCGETFEDGIKFCPSCGTGTASNNAQNYSNAPSVDKAAQNGNNFGNAIMAFITKIVNFSDKAGKTEFWFGCIFFAIVMAGISFLNGVPVIKYFTWLVYCADCLALISNTVRRLNDIGFKRSHVFIYLIPIYGIIRWVMDMLKPSNSVTN